MRICYTLGDDKFISNDSDKACTDQPDMQLIGFREILSHSNWESIKVSVLITAIWNEEEVSATLEFDRADLQRDLICNCLVIQRKLSIVGKGSCICNINLDKFVLFGLL